MCIEKIFRVLKTKRAKQLGFVYSLASAVIMIVYGPGETCDQIQFWSFWISIYQLVATGYIIFGMLALQKLKFDGDGLYDMALCHAYLPSAIPMSLYIPVTACFLRHDFCTSCLTFNNVITEIFLIYNTVSFLQYLIAYMALKCHVVKKSMIYTCTVPKNDLR